MNRIVRVELNAGSWYGHPEQHTVERSYNRAMREAKMAGRACVGDEWTSPLVCWNLIGSDGIGLGRAYAPSEKTPRWVFTDWRGEREVPRLVSHEQLMLMLVTYCLREGRYVDTLHV